MLVAVSVVGVLLAGLVLVLGTGRAGRGPAGGSGEVPVAGHVVDALTGEPLQARVVVHGRTSTSGADGGFRARLDAPALARIEAPGHLARVVALDPAHPARVGLTPDRDGAVSLRFGGDVMLGRRYFHATPERRAWLSAAPTREELAAPLADVAPLLGDADLTVVNLETALVPHPYVDGPRPAWAHPEKDLVITSPVGLAAALADAGVDVVDLANNHVYDALEPGVSQTLEAVDAAGLARFGAGHTIEDAWRPAYVERRGQRVAFLGCTTVDGAQHRVGYVATADHGGAARCEAPRIRRAVSAARARADIVVFLIHGGTEYVRRQTPQVRGLSRLAVRSGASLVVDGHPHVAGGVTSYRGAPIVESAGNLLFDQVLWETFLSHVARFDFSSGRVVRSVLDPIVLDDYRPVPTVSTLADAAARIGADGRSPLLLADGAAAGPRVGAGPDLPAPDRLDIPDGRVTALPPGTWLGEARAELRVGRDLLWGSGGMEQLSTSLDSGDRTALWHLGRFAAASGEAACSGRRGLLLRRSPVSARDVIATPAHRQAVSPGERLTLVADVGKASAGAVLELRWYAGASGSSTDTVAVDVPERLRRSGCEQVRLDVTVPPGAHAVQPFVRLRPPSDVNLSAELWIDDIRLVAWGPAGASGRRWDVVEALGQDAVVTLRRDAVAR
jgi:poly-gamma-glutamate synthesis protein (capsule biosynthesis protein)